MARVTEGGGGIPVGVGTPEKSVVPCKTWDVLPEAPGRGIRFTSYSELTLSRRVAEAVETGDPVRRLGKTAIGPADTVIPVDVSAPASPIRIAYDSQRMFDEPNYLPAETENACWIQCRPLRPGLDAVFPICLSVVGRRSGFARSPNRERWLVPWRTLGRRKPDEVGLFSLDPPNRSGRLQQLAFPGPMPKSAKVQNDCGRLGRAG